MSSCFGKESLLDIRHLIYQILHSNQKLKIELENSSFDICVAISKSNSKRSIFFLLQKLEMFYDTLDPSFLLCLSHQTKVHYWWSKTEWESYCCKRFIGHFCAAAITFAHHIITHTYCPHIHKAFPGVCGMRIHGLPYSCTTLTKLVF